MPRKIRKKVINKKNKEKTVQDKANSNFGAVSIEEKKLTVVPPPEARPTKTEENLPKSDILTENTKQVSTNDVKNIKVINQDDRFISITGSDSDRLVIDETETVMTSSGLKKRYIDITRKKKPALRAKHRRLRQNRRLRKILTPKNAAMALHELKGNVLCEYVTHGDGCSLFVAEVTVDGAKYRGSGSSKTSAKNSASENALRNIALNKILNKPKDDSVEAKESDNMGQSVINRKTKTASQGQQETSEESETNDNNLKDSQMDDCSVCSSSTNNANDDGDDVPMLHIASFALYKLFKEWENEGKEVPELKTSVSAALLNNTLSLPQLQAQLQPPIICVPPTTPSTNNINMMLNSILNDDTKIDVSFIPKTELPPRANEFHPTILLSMLRPGITYADLGSNGKSPQITHTVGVTVDGTQFIGSARSKKLARRYVAREACNTIFGTKIPPDETLM